MAKKQFILLFSLLLSVLIATNVNARTPLPRKYRKIQHYLDMAAPDKMAGIAIYVKSPNYGEWTTTSGYANLSTKQLLAKDDIFAMASIGKMYTAVAILKLTEEGILHLDDPISKYLSREIIGGLANGSKITIRQLLAHTSGLYNYDKDPELNSQYLSGRLKLDTLTHLNALRRYVFGKPALCTPGSAFHYSSTNYVLLAMIADAVVPEGHANYLSKLLLQHGFTHTYYRQTPVQNNIHYYGDLNQDSITEDVTLQTLETTNWFTGDDGVYAPVSEAARFLEDLMTGKILNQQSLKEMMTWDNDKKPNYGLGLMANKAFPYHFLMGHSGRGIGTTTDLYYFPRQKMTIAIFCNTGLRGAAPIFRKSYNKMRTRIINKLFLF